ncbi:MAG: adenylyltransferase/cytidyltransferase family protein [Vulcanimicrobiaceae bacterium]
MSQPQEFFGVTLDLAAALLWRSERRSSGQRVAFTNGCFDVLHAGHVAYLAWARAQGDALIVGLNADASVQALKGAARPIVPFAQRAQILCALRSVDVVVGFEERTPEILLDRLRPDVHIKSAQYRIEELPERRVVAAYGGEIRLAPHVDAMSTTETIARILARYATS